MITLVELIRSLREATAGSPELDQLVIDYLTPGKRLAGRSLHYTRSLDAKLPGEDVVSVERLPRVRETWRARLQNNWTADGNTEALARRLAILTYDHFDQVGRLPRHRPLMRDVWRNDRLRRKARRADDYDDTPAPLLPEVDGEWIVDLFHEALRRVGTQAPLTPLPEVPTDQFGNLSVRIVASGNNAPHPSNGGQNATSTLSQILEDWRQEVRPVVKNVARVERSIERFIGYVGDLPMNQYTKADVRSFLRELIDVPVSVPWSMRKKSIKVLKAYGQRYPNGRTLTPATIKAHLKDVHMIFNWAIAMDLCAANPANSLRVIDHRNKSELRVPYDIDDLRLMFERTPQYTGCLRSNRRKLPGDKIFKDALFWVPLVALFTGARSSEITGATYDDFKTEGDIFFLEIRARANRRLKTHSAARRIPIHNELIRMGLKPYLDSQHDAIDGRVFTHVVGQRDIRTRQAWVRTWQLFQDSMGLTDRRKVFHSFRHTFKRACREAGIEEEVHDLLTGHRPYESGRRYGAGISLSRLNDAMQRVRFEGLDLSHLYDRS